MSNKLTYIEARDKIWAAYFRDEIKPYDPEFCFCGTLNENDDGYWLTYTWKRDGFYYTGDEFQRMEVALFSKTNRNAFMELRDEELLFAGMLAALEVLKQIHRGRGDFIPEDEPLLTKRKLVQTVR